MGYEPNRYLSRARIPLIVGFLFASALLVAWRAHTSSSDWPLGALFWRISLGEWRVLLGFMVGAVLGARGAEPRGSSQQVLISVAAALGIWMLRTVGSPSFSFLWEFWLVLIWFAVPITFGFIGSHLIVKENLLERWMTLGALLGILGAVLITVQWWRFYISSHGSGVSSWLYLWEARSLLLALVAVWASVKRKPLGLVVAFLLTFSPVLFSAADARRGAPSVLYLVGACVFLLDAPLVRRFRLKARHAALAGFHFSRAFLHRSSTASFRILSGRETGPVMKKETEMVTRFIAGLLGLAGITILVPNYQLWQAAFFLLVPNIFGWALVPGLLILFSLTVLAAGTLTSLWYAVKPSARLGLLVVILCFLALAAGLVDAAVLGRDIFWDLWELSDPPIPP